MQSSWPAISLGNLVTRGDARLQTGPFGSQLHKHDYVEAGVPIIPTEAIGRGTILADAVLPQISPEKAAELGRHCLQVGDILFARRGVQATGLSAIVSARHANALCGTGAILLRVNPDAIDPQFLSAYLATDGARSWLRAHAVGAVMPNLNTEIISQLLVPLPEISVQRDIALLSRTLDRRIDLQRQTNATLESIAQALFKSWFVDFDPVRAKAEGRELEGMNAAGTALFPDGFEESELGLIPKGWKVQRIQEVAAKVAMGPFGSNIKVATFVDEGVPIISGQHLKEALLEDATFNFITEEHAARLSRSLVREGDIIFTHAGNIGQVSLIPRGSTYDTYVLSQRQFYLRCNSEAVTPEFMTYYFRSPLGQHRLLANASQVGVPSIARPASYLKSLEVVVPPGSISRLFTNVVTALHDSIVSGRRRIKTLSNLRDTLLPRLISGKLHLPEAEAPIKKAIEEAVA